MPLAALVAPDGTISADVSTHTDKEQDVVYLAFASAMEPERQTCVATLVIAAQVWPRSKVRQRASYACADARYTAPECEPAQE